MVQLVCEVLVAAFYVVLGICHVWHAWRKPGEHLEFLIGLLLIGLGLFKLADIALKLAYLL